MQAYLLRVPEVNLLFRIIGILPYFVVALISKSNENQTCNSILSACYPVYVPVNQLLGADDGYLVRPDLPDRYPLSGDRVHRHEFPLGDRVRTG